MDDDLDGIVTNIRACILSSKGPIPVRNLSRDYETIVGSQIPFRQFNYATLEDFLGSLPSLRVCGKGAQALVEAATSGASSHVTALISKQKSAPKKLASLPQRRSYPYTPSFRGRGSSRGRGRGSYPTRPYASRDPAWDSYRNQPNRDYNGHDNREYPSRDQPTRDYPARNQSRDYPVRDQSRDYPARDQSRDYSARDQSRDYPARDQSRDYHARDQSRDYPARDQSRDYPARDQSRDYPARDQSRDYAGRDYNHTNSAPTRYSPDSHNRQDTDQPGGPLTVTLDGDDKRQVSWKKNELPPRFQKKVKEPNTNTQQNADIPPAPSVSSGSEGFDSSLFLNSASNSASSSNSLTDWPSQLVVRAKEKVDKAKEKQSFGTLDLLPSSSQGTNDLAEGFARLSHQDSGALAVGNHRTSLNGHNQNDLAAGFARLSHQDSNVLAVGNHRTSLHGHNQILEDPTPILLPPSEDLPKPDDDFAPNNVNILQKYCVNRGWPNPTYTVSHRKSSSTHQITYLAAVKVNGNGAYNFKVGTGAYDYERVDFARGFAAKNALERILVEESKKVKADNIISSDSDIICSRISDIVAGASNGLFANSVEDEYINRHNELLPDNWLQTVRSWPTLSVESTVNSTIILPRVPSPEPVLFNPTVAPPPLSIEALGDADNIEDVYITHATSVNNVWFRVIGKDYSDAYEVLVEQMDTYYNGAGAQELALAVEVGQYYAAHHFDTWFRVCVTQVDDDSQTAVAWLVDHGDNEKFQFSSLYRLAPQFCQLPRQAVLCTLEGLESFNDDEFASKVVTDSDLLIAKSLVAKISHKDNKAGLVKATLYDTSSDEDIIVNEQIKDEIITKAKPVLPDEGCAMEVTIGDVSKKGEVHIMFNGPSLDRIVEILESLGSDKISEHKLTSFKHISLNKLYLAKYSKDDTWYRAVVTTTPSLQHNKIPVRFVDYGNTESVSISDIADLENLPPMLKKLPAQAVKVALHNLPLESLTNPEVARLHSLLLDEEKVVLIKTISLKAVPPIVEIFTKEADNAGLVSVNSTIELQRKLNRSEEKKNLLNLASSDANCNQLINNKDDFVLQCPDFSDSEFQAVLVVLAAHPGNFIFQPVKYAKELKKLRGQMSAYYDAGALPELPPDRVVKNKLFAARFIDDLWYRVLVTDSPPGTRVAVRLCDFGDVTCVSISSLRELAPEFQEYPFMAVKGKLAGVVPVHKDWSVEDCIRFQDIVVDKILAGIIVNVQPNKDTPMEMIVTLNLVNTSSEKDQDIAEILLQEQRAVRG